MGVLGKLRAGLDVPADDRYGFGVDKSAMKPRHLFAFRERFKVDESHYVFCKPTILPCDRLDN